MGARRILIVEDEVVVAMELEQKLAQLGYQVSGITAYGEEAVRTAGELRPDLVLMDIKLAGKIDGIEAASYIHNVYNIPVVFLTAHSDESTLQRAKLSEPFGYLVKPFSEVELRTTIEVSLHKHEQDKKAREASSWFSRVLNVVDGAVILTDENGTVRDMNPLAETLTGWDREEARGREISDVYVLKIPDTGKIVKHLALTMFRDNAPLPSSRCILVTRHQTEVPVEISAIPIEDPDGQLSAVIFAFEEDLSQLNSGQDRFSHAANLLLTAELCRADGDSVCARSFYQRALDILTKPSNRDGARVSSLLRDLSSIYREQGKYGEARILELQAIRMRADIMTDRALTRFA